MSENSYELVVDVCPPSVCGWSLNGTDVETWENEITYFDESGKSVTAKLK